MSKFSVLADNIASRASNLFSTFESALDGTSQKVATLSGNAPTIVSGTAAVVSDIKQGASDLIGLGDSVVDYGLTTYVPTIENALDALFLKATGGAGAPAIPMINGGIDQLASIVKSVVDNAALRAKASLVPVNPAP